MLNKIQTLGGYFHEYQKSIANPELFWENIAENFFWRKRWTKVLEHDFEKPEVKWFVDAELNITENIFEKNILMRGEQTAIIWEPNDPAEKAQHITYNELFSQVKKFSNVLKNNGIEKGDRVAIYMPPVPEATVAMLACARVGAVHSVVFAGFSSQALADRINDSDAKMVLTSDGAYRGQKITPTKDIVDEAIEKTETIKKVIVLKRTGKKINMKTGRDLWWHDEIRKVDDKHSAEIMNAEDMLFILYTSGSTGKPKGVVHTTGGYMVYACYSFKNVFQYKTGDVFWCTADIGWITGHTYLVYGPLLAGATTVIFEGIPTYPDAGRFWEISEKHKVNQFYTAPTAIRAMLANGHQELEKYDLSALQILGTVGEPINEEAWHWYHDHVGNGKCPITDTWWQTETGGIMIAPLPGITPTKPSYATLPLPGIQPVLVDSEGKELKGNSVEGNLCIKFPWPGMFRTTYGNHQRYKETYFDPYKGYYFTGDSCKRDEDGYYRILGRVDDVINVSGHRLGTAEVENAINEHPLINESAVVGYPHDIKGQGIFAYVVGEQDVPEETINRLPESVRQTVNKIIGPIAKPDKIVMVSGLPKTRSGKIMRRILRKIAEDDASALGDTSTLLNPEIVEEIKLKVLGPAE